MGRRKNSSADNPSKDRQGNKNSSAEKISKDREGSWKTIFKGLVDLVQGQQQQLESLERRIRSQHDKWVFDVKLLKDHISQMRRCSKVDAAKRNLILSMKQKEAIMYKLRFEDAEDERGDLKLIFDELSQRLREPKHATRSSSKNVDESALKAERDFAWNQFKKTDAQLQEHIKKTKSEAEAANDKIQKLVSDLEQSQSLNMEMSRKITALQDDMAVLESDSRRKSEENSRLTKELELLRGDSNNRSITPVLRLCTVSSGKHINIKKAKSEVEAANDKIQKLVSELEQSQSLNMEMNRKISALQDDMAVLESDSRRKSEENSRLTKELQLLRGDSNNRSITPVLRLCTVASGSRSSDMAITEKGERRSSKRKGDDSDTEPRLFTSRFKVPKVKHLST